LFGNIARGFHRHYMIWAAVLIFMLAVLFFICWCFGETAKIVGTVVCVLILVAVGIWCYVTEMQDKRESEEANKIN
jgi:uncharacterized membrane protein YhaH (DUF805 family)